MTTDPDGPKPAIEVITGFLPGETPPDPVGKSSASASEAYRELIALELERGRIETQPGEEAEVDYGTGPMVRDLRW